MRFRYPAMNQGGELQRGEREGASSAEVAAFLQKTGAMVLNVRPAGRGAGLQALELSGGGSLRRGELMDAMRAARGRAIAQDQPVTLTLPRLPGWLAAPIQAPPGGFLFAPDGSSSGGAVRLDGDGPDYTVSAGWLTGQARIDAN